MASGEEYRRQIGEYKSHRALLKLWQQIVARDTPEWEPGKAFEFLILRAFEIEKADICWPFPVNLADQLVEQIDGVVYAAGLSCLVEAKDCSDKTAMEPIAKLRSQLLRRPVGVIGALFSSSGFTDPSVTLSRFLGPPTILLWGPEDVMYCLKKKSMVDGLRRKYRYAVEQGLPDLTLQESE
ncbi:MAG: hypothetical protein H7062_13385 [Candidatus Saccharimonas sp.]|nr:hypothetical protein [Planctomycetaceae bacterium]